MLERSAHYRMTGAQTMRHFRKCPNTPDAGQDTLAFWLVDLSPVDELLARSSDDIRNYGRVSLDSEERILRKGDLGLLIILVDADLDDRQKGTPFLFTSLDAPLDTCPDPGGQV